MFGILIFIIHKWAFMRWKWKLLKSLIFTSTSYALDHLFYMVWPIVACASNNVAGTKKWPDGPHVGGPSGRAQKKARPDAKRRTGQDSRGRVARLAYGHDVVSVSGH